MRKTNKPIAVIFDMDGVIIDSNPLIAKAWKSFFSTHDMTLTTQQFNQIVYGRTSSETITLAFNNPLSTDEIGAYCHELDGIVQTLYATEGKIVAGFTDFVELLIENSIAVAIATSAPMPNVAVVLEMAKATPYFSVILDSTQVQHSKPHPEIYLQTAATLGVDPANCLVFEDSFSGIQSAKSAGMNVIGVTTTHSPAELLPLTEAVVADFTHVTIEQIHSLIAIK